MISKPKPTNKSVPVKPVVAQLKTRGSAIKQPAAPHVYRPQPVPKVLQTKRAPGAQNLQTDRAPRQPVAPPVYRPEVKKIVQPKMSASQRQPPTAPPAFRPEQKKTLQPKVAAKTPPQTALGHRPPQPWTRLSAVVQRARRDKVEDTRELPGANVPDLMMESYKSHVATRTVRFFQHLVSTAANIIRHKGMVRPSLYSDHARVQVQSGQRHKGPETVPGENNWDAAHLMNTSLDRRQYAVETGQMVDDPDVEARYVASGATINQFQKSNVSADKIIDKQQTDTKNELLGELQHGATLDAALVERHVLRYLTNLAGNLKAGASATGVISGMAIRDDSYTAALEVIMAQLGEIGFIMTSIRAELPDGF